MNGLRRNEDAIVFRSLSPKKFCVTKTRKMKCVSHQSINSYFCALYFVYVIL